MLGITLTVDQINAAPPEVRHWIEGQITATFGVPDRSPQDAVASSLDGFTPCTADEVMDLFEAVKDDYLACQLLFELGRELPTLPAPSPELYVANLPDILKHTRIQQGQLATCFAKLHSAFQALRRDPDTAFFLFDDHGRCYLHRNTHDLIHQLWADFIATQMKSTAGDRNSAAPRPARATMPPVTVAAPYQTHPTAILRPADRLNPLTRSF